MSRRRRATSGLLAAVVSALCAGSVRAEPADGAAPLPARSLEALSLLHQGRFDAASSAFAEISRTRPGDPEGPLFEALTVWWRLIDSPEDEGLRVTIQERLAEAVRRGEGLIERGDVQRGRIFTGTAQLLTAQTEAFSGGYLAAGRAARAGHELLEAALVADPGASDARFALGAYKYFAARLPWLVRLLRVFVRLPGGSLEEGLAALKDAADGGLYFRSEALLLLAYIHSEGDEADLREAHRYLARARRLEPASPLLAAIEARFHFDMGRLADTERIARESLSLAAQAPGVAPAVPALAKLRLAFALFYQYRHREASEVLGQLAPSREDLPRESRPRMDALLERLRESSAAASGAEAPGARSAGSVSPAPLPADREAREAIEKLLAGRPREAADLLGRAATKLPDDAVVRYHFARASQIAGDHVSAERELQRLLSSPGKLPKTLRGWALLRIGAALEARGRAAEAPTYYRRAAGLDGFVFRGAAHDRLAHPEEVFAPEG